VHDLQSEIDKVSRQELKRIVNELPTDSELDLNKKKMIKKMKADKKKSNLMAMLKTVKRRKADDLVAEATSELEQIEKIVEATPVDISSADFVTDETSDEPKKTRPKLELPMPKRFKPEVLKEWDKEFQLAIPAFA